MNLTGEEPGLPGVQQQGPEAGVPAVSQAAGGPRLPYKQPSIPNEGDETRIHPSPNEIINVFFFSFLN